MTPVPGAARIWGVLALASAVSAAALVIGGAPPPAWMSAASLALVMIGAALASWGGAIAATTTDREARHPKGPGLERRRLLMGLGAVGAATVAALVAVPAFVRTGEAAGRLSTTVWRRGTRLVDESGRVILAGDVVAGSLFTAYPDGSLGDAQAQVLLVGVEDERLRLDREGWAPPGMVAYSKLCTHMACPIGLYQESTGTAVCPCHQAVFDILGGGAVVTGPAGRALPQLPIAVADDGSLVALGDFSDAVGTDFWRAR